MALELTKIGVIRNPRSHANHGRTSAPPAGLLWGEPETPGALAEDLLADATAEERRYDLVVVDPPRAGLHKKVIQGILDLGPDRFLYVSCNAESLAQDLAEFVSGGYEIQVAQPVDLFPHTPHCEVITFLIRTPSWQR